MKTLSIILLCLAFGQSITPSRAEEPTVVSLPPFTVIADLFTIDARGKKGVVDYARVRDVTPGTKPFVAGLRDGYALVSIFGKPVVGMKREEYAALLARLPQPRNPKTFRFIRKRGIFRSEKIIDLIFSTDDETPEPNQALEPTSTAVTPPASASAVLRRDESAGDRASGTRGSP